MLCEQKCYTVTAGTIRPFLEDLPTIFSDSKYEKHFAFSLGVATQSLNVAMKPDLKRTYLVNQIKKESYSLQGIFGEFKGQDIWPMGKKCP